MNDAERFENTRLFIAALLGVLSRPEQPIPFDPRVFAKVVDDLKKNGNAFAERFQTFNTVAGKSCPDFQQGMTAAQSAGLISRLNPTYEFFSVRMSPRLAKGTLQAVKQAEADDLRKVARRYFEVVLDTSH